MEKFSPLYKMFGLLSREHEDCKDSLMGRILTIIDASISDPEQRKGIKDLIRDSRYNSYDSFDTKMRYIMSQFNDKFSKFKMEQLESEFWEKGSHSIVNVAPEPYNYFKSEE